MAMGPHYSLAAPDPRCRGASALLLGPSRPWLQSWMSGASRRGLCPVCWVYATFMVPPRRETEARDADRPAPAPPTGSGSDAERRTSGRLLVRAGTIAPRNENEIANRFTIRSETQEQLTMGWILSWIRIMSPSSCLHDRSSPAISISCESVGSVGLCFTAAAHKNGRREPWTRPDADEAGTCGA